MKTSIKFEDDYSIDGDIIPNGRLICGNGLKDVGGNISIDMSKEMIEECIPNMETSHLKELYANWDNIKTIMEKELFKRS